MSELLKLLKINPELPARTVFKYLKYESGPHELADVKNKTLIACTSRTGSSLLRVCLERYGLDAQEYFNVEAGPKKAFENGAAKTTHDYANFLARTASPNGHFAVKGAYPAFLFLYYMNEIPTFNSRWKVIFLRRKNLVRQAISMSFADITQQWSFRMPAKATVRAEDYSFETVMKHMEAAYSANQTWERVFGLLGVEPLRLFYEDFIDDMNGHTERVAEFAGIDIAAFPHAHEHVPRLKSQSTEANDEWEQRFRSEMIERISKIDMA